MLQSRTARTLTTLFTAMTVGALSLMWMETAPIDEPTMPLTAVSGDRIPDDAIIYDTTVPLKQPKWINIVVSQAPAADHVAARACHFIVSGGDRPVESTELWKSQFDGHHTFAPGGDWNANSVGVCFVGDIDDASLSGPKFAKLMGLIQMLQHRLNVRPERVYLQSQLDTRTKSPTRPFSRAFSRGLLQASAVSY